ncbi:XisI protein, partial [Nostoc sp. CHAB 5836]|uniref:element excision factor XisI family protein n=1 Tax=Nostoc sp. CHAB 5836 TaxID=2780404 RepID=UPI001E62217D
IQFDLSPNLSPKRREALNITPLPLQGRGWGLGLYSMQLRTAIAVRVPIYEVGEDLVNLGIPKQDIVIGFHSPFKRQFTDYAVV